LAYRFIPTADQRALTLGQVRYFEIPVLGKALASLLATFTADTGYRDQRFWRGAATLCPRILDGELFGIASITCRRNDLTGVPLFNGFRIKPATKVRKFKLTWTRDGPTPYRIPRPTLLTTRFSWDVTVGQLLQATLLIHVRPSFDGKERSEITTLALWVLPSWLAEKCLRIFGTQPGGTVWPEIFRSAVWTIAEHRGPSLGGQFEIRGDQASMDEDGVLMWWSRLPALGTHVNSMGTSLPGRLGVTPGLDGPAPKQTIYGVPCNLPAPGPLYLGIVAIANAPHS